MLWIMSLIICGNMWLISHEDCRWLSLFKVITAALHISSFFRGFFLLWFEPLVFPIYVMWTHFCGFLAYNVYTCSTFHNCVVSSYKALEFCVGRGTLKGDIYNLNGFIWCQLLYCVAWKGFTLTVCCPWHNHSWNLMCVFVCVFPRDTRWHYGYIIPGKSYCLSLSVFLSFSNTLRLTNTILLCHVKRTIRERFHMFYSGEFGSVDICLCLGVCGRCIYLCLCFQSSTFVFNFLEFSSVKSHHVILLIPYMPIWNSCTFNRCLQSRALKFYLFVCYQRLGSVCACKVFISSNLCVCVCAL